MQYTINELKHKVFQNIYNVYEIFKNFYGEEYTDLQGIPNDEEFIYVIRGWTGIDNIIAETPLVISDEDYIKIASVYNARVASIIVWWPRVTVTNENDKSIVIRDLYAKVEINVEGKIPYEYHGFLLTRSTYDSIQFQTGYCHSHVPSFSPTYPHSEIVKWRIPCLGRGPIKNTILELKNNNEETIWMLFCHELSLYVTVESLTGVPYIRLEEVGNKEQIYTYTGYSDYENNMYRYYSSDVDDKDIFFENLKRFALYYLKHGDLHFNYQNGSFIPGMSYFDYMIDVANCFIEWFNKYGSKTWAESLFNKGFLLNSFVADGKFYKAQRANESTIDNIEGHPVLNFKGNRITLHIIKTARSETQNTIILNHNIAMYILKNILKIVNYRYRNEHNNRKGAGTSCSAPTYQKIAYL